MKDNNKGFMLAETLIVTTFVAGVLIFIFIQFNSLSSNYRKSYSYNSVESIYALKNIKNYIESDSSFYDYIILNVSNNKYLDITNCSLASNIDFCKRLFELENVDRIIVSTNRIYKSAFDKISDEEFLSFINNISYNGDQKYRLIASFKDSKYATIRFGE